MQVTGGRALTGLKYRCGLRNRWRQDGDPGCGSGVTARSVEVSSSTATLANAVAEVEPQVIVAFVIPELMNAVVSPVVGVAYPRLVGSVLPVGVVIAGGLVPSETAVMIGFPVSGVRERTGAGVVPSVPVDWPPEERIACNPTRVIPEMRNTSSPPPVEAVWVAVKVVEDADPISLFGTQTVRLPEVENPVNVEPTLV